jgi:hypothetical protein
MCVPYRQWGCGAGSACLPITSPGRPVPCPIVRSHR